MYATVAANNANTPVALVILYQMTANNAHQIEWCVVCFLPYIATSRVA